MDSVPASRAPLRMFGHREGVSRSETWGDLLVDRRGLAPPFRGEKWRQLLPSPEIEELQVRTVTRR
jgi:hypothetical protein